MEQELYYRGLDKAAAGDYESAIEEFNRAIEINPNFVDAYYQRGLAQFDLGKRQNAIADYTKALSINPNKIEACLGRSIANFAEGNMQQTIEDAEGAIAIEINCAAAYKLLGSAYSRQGKNEEAIANFKQAAEFYLEQKDTVNCRKCLDNIKKLQPPPPPEKKTETKTSLPVATTEEYIIQILRKFEKGDRRKAIEDLNWALQVDPRDAKAYCCRGIMFYKMGNNQRAMSDFDKALQFDSRNILAYRNRGIIRSELGDNKGAIADFQKAIEIDPNNSITYVSRGNALRDMGNYALAIKDYNKALEINPNDAKAYYQRGVAYSRLEEMKKAIDDYENAVKIFGDKGDWDNYQKTLDRLKQIQSSPAKQQNKTNTNAEKTRLREKLLILVGGYWEIAERLIEQARQNFPGRQEEWYWQKVIADLERDRRNF